MDIQSILIACGIGIIAGWLASLIVKGGSSGLLGNLVIGILGGFIGHWLLPKIGLNLASGVVGVIISAFIGALVMLIVLRLVLK